MQLLDLPTNSLARGRAVRSACGDERRQRLSSFMVRISRSGRQRVAAWGAAALMLLLVAPVMSGCSSHGLIDSLPSSVGGLPEGAPERPAVQPAYPAVHDMPPARAEGTLSEDEKKKLKEDLIASRERAARRATNRDTSATGSTPASGAARNP